MKDFTAIIEFKPPIGTPEPNVGTYGESARAEAATALQAVLQRQRSYKEKEKRMFKGMFA
jgi:hypothetical protein